MLRSIDLNLRERLKDKAFRREWYRAQLAAEVPDLFRDLRDQRKITQKQLADETGMKQSAVSRFEQSTEANWKLETLIKIAEALDAQIIISLVKYEDILKKFEGRERRREKKGLGSVIDAVNSSFAERPNHSDPVQFIDLDKFGPIGHKELSERETGEHRFQPHNHALYRESAERAAASSQTGGGPIGALPVRGNSHSNRRFDRRKGSLRARAVS